jgi:hypothetical protein
MAMISPPSVVLCALVLIAPFAGCSRDNTAGALTGRIVDSSGGTVVSLGMKRVAYRPTAMPASGTISGRVTLKGFVPDTGAPKATAQAPGASDDCTDAVDVASSSDGIANALVWIDSLTTGKPLPDERRETYNVDRCGFDPPILAVVAPSTINVFSRDRSVHDLHFYRQGNGAVDSIRTMDEGEVVPTERIAAVPGIVEVRDSRMPGARGFIAAFNHPYFAVTDAAGSFRIDGLQPGTYTIKIWHERLTAPIEQRVVIGPNGAGHVDVQLDLH